MPSACLGGERQEELPVVQVDFYAMVNNLYVLIMIDSWTRYVTVEPLENKLASVIGQMIARFLSMLGYFDKVEVTYGQEPVLAAGVEMAQTIRANQGLEKIAQPGVMYAKGRTALAERSIQTVRA